MPRFIERLRRLEARPKPGRWFPPLVVRTGQREAIELARYTAQHGRAPGLVFNIRRAEVNHAND